MQKKFSAKKWDQLLDVGMQKQKQLWNQDAKKSPKTTSPHIHFTYRPYQVGLVLLPPINHSIKCTRLVKNVQQSIAINQI